MERTAHPTDPLIFRESLLFPSVRDGGAYVDTQCRREHPTFNAVFGRVPEYAGCFRYERKTMPTETVRQHARRVLASLEANVELIETVRRALELSPRAAVRARRNDLRSWCLARIKDLSGATSFQEAFANRDVLTLVAFGYLGVTRHPEWPAARVRPSMPVPKALAQIEPDFFDALLHEVRSEAKASPSFGATLKAAERDVTRIVARLRVMTAPNRMPEQRTGKKPLTVTARSAAGDAGNLVLGVAVIWLVIKWVDNTVHGNK